MNELTYGNYIRDGEIVVGSIRHNSRRKGIIKPVRTNTEKEPICEICPFKSNHLNAYGVCCICEKVICKRHCIEIREKKYCTLCRNNEHYGTVIQANNNHELNEKKYNCNCIIS